MFILANDIEVLMYIMVAKSAGIGYDELKKDFVQFCKERNIPDFLKEYLDKKFDEYWSSVIQMKSNEELK